MRRCLLCLALVFVAVLQLLILDAPLWLVVAGMGVGVVGIDAWLRPEHDHGDVGEDTDAADHGQCGGGTQ